MLPDSDLFDIHKLFDLCSFTEKVAPSYKDSSGRLPVTSLPFA